jgi:hypothetical protein
MTRILRHAAALPTALFAVTALAQPVVVVQDFGEAPRAEIRYTFTPDATVTATMTMRMQMSMGGQPMGMAMPAISIPITARTTEVRGDGTARYEFESAAPSIAGGSGGNLALEQMLASSLGQVGNLSGWYRIDTRGNILETSYTLPDGALPPGAGQMMNEMSGQMQQLSAPFPAEAIGVGARWQTTSTMVIAGTPLTQITEYTLLARNGDTVELGMKVGQTVTAPVAAPGVPTAAQAAMGETQGSGTGKMTIDLTSMVPQSDMTMDTTMSMAMPGPGQGQAQGMTVAMQMTITITPD